MDEMLKELRAKLADKLATRAAEADKQAAVLARAEARAEGERNLTEEETAEFRGASEAKKAIDEETGVLEARISEIEDEKRRDDAAAKLRAEMPSQHRSAAVVTREQRTYTPETDRRGEQFLRDVGAAFLGDYESRDRISRHITEERVDRGSEFRAAGTGAFAGLTVPQYLVDLVAPAAAAARPLANICTKHDLPAQGMTVNISRITTATSAAAQSAENAAVSETNIDDTLLTESILTVAGQQTLSRQSIERSAGAEDVTLNDLMRRYHTALDSKLINDATTGLTNVAQSVAYTDATPTAAELWPKFLNAQANIESVMLDLGTEQEYAVMHSRRWAWLQSQVGTSWPFIAQPGIPTQAGGVNNGTGYADGVRGVLPNGTKVIVDNNISTALGAGTEDEIYFVNAAECHLWEDPNAPVYIRAEQPAAASLGVLLVVYGYFAYTFRRYTNGQQKIAGTGLIAPTF
jgi:HK97 family phage major capsid protein